MDETTWTSVDGAKTAAAVAGGDGATAAMAARDTKGDEETLT